MQCPRCASDQIVKNGSIHNGKPKYLCTVCRRQFVEDPQDRCIPDDTKALIDRLLLERISLAGIARAVGVSERWLQTYVNQKDADQPRHVQVRSKKKPVDRRMRRIVVVRVSQRQQTVGVAGP